MVRNVSDRWRDTSASGGRLLGELICHSPQTGWEPYTLTFDDLKVKQSGGTGARWTATASVIPEPGEGTWAIVAWPGAWFTIRVGMRYGPNDSEWITFGEYCHDDMPTYEVDGPIDLHLADRWSDLAKAKYGWERKSEEGDRARIVQRVVTQALGNDVGVSIDVTDPGEHTYDPNDENPPMWDERTKLIEDMADDGGFIAYFDADGRFLIRDEPEIRTPVAHFSDGVDGTVMTLDRGGRFDEFYNTVTVVYDNDDPDEGDPFDPQTVVLDEPNNPVDPSNMRGLRVVYQHKTKTIRNAARAEMVARKQLALKLRQRVERTLSTVNGAYLEPGDTIAVSTVANIYENAVTERWLITENEFDVMSGETTFTLTSDRQPNMTTDRRAGSPGAGLLPGGGLLPLSVPAGSVIVPGDTTLPLPGQEV